MIRVHSDVIQFRGSHYDFGYAQGESLKNSLLLKNRKVQWLSSPYSQVYIDVKAFKRDLLRFSPPIYEEIMGLQDALQLSIEDTIRLFGGYDTDRIKSGCSIFLTEEYMVRNYDNAPQTYEGRFVFYQPTDRGYASLGPSMQITGRTDGMNEKGLVMGYNFINTKQKANGFICNMIGRLVLENCGTIDEAIELLKAIPHRHSFSYPLLDAKGNYVVVEASPRDVVVHQEHLCTNHFTKLTQENRYRMEDSLRRKKEMAKQETSVTDSLSAYKMMNDTERGVFSTSYGTWSGTLHTALYIPKERTVGFALGGDRKPVFFSFAEWLKGKRLPITTINGELKSQIGFANRRLSKA